MRHKVATHNKPPENLLLTLKEGQAKYGYLSRELIEELAEFFGVPVNDVYGVASFYSFLAVKPQGRNVIRICKSLPCYLKGCRIIIDTVEKEIGIRPGGITHDGRFSFELTNCIGLCDKAPAMLVNSDAHVELTPEKIARLLRDYK